MVKSVVTINEERCHGCGYCVEFCPRGCLEEAKDNIGPLEYAIPVFAKPEQCNTCGYCARMCPYWAIEGYLSIEMPGKEAILEKVTGPPRLAPTPPLGNCPGCQHPTVGRMIAEVLDELGLDGNFIALDGISCNTSSTFGMDFGQVIGFYDNPIEVAIANKRRHPDKIVFAVQNGAKFDVTGFDSFLAASASGEKITIIICHDTAYRPFPIEWHIDSPIHPFMDSGVQESINISSPMPFAELVAHFGGVAYSARGAITSPDDYERTKGYIRAAFQKQMDDVGFSFVEVLCGCFAFSYYEYPTDCLKWIKEKMVTDLPLGEFKNVKRTE
jgi:2-oxoglutarate/2-oxoacid ferredoxin oxidoreductase subunit beta